MHRLLKRQIRRLFKDESGIPAACVPLVDMVDGSYHQFDDDRELIERSLELSSTELTQKNAELRAVFQAFPDLFVWLDHEGTVIDCKGGQGTSSFMTCQGMIGRRLVDLPLLTNAREPFQRALANVANSGHGAEFVFSLESDGQTRYLELRLQPLVKGRCIAILRDVTESKHTEAALRQAEEKYRAIFEHAVEGIFVTTFEGRYLSANPAQARIFGFDSPQALLSAGPCIAWDHYSVPADRQAVLQALLTRGEIANWEIKARRRDGAEIYVAICARAVRDAEGEWLHIEGSCTDISSRKIAEASLKRAYDELEKRVAERTAALTASNEALRQEIQERRRLEAQYKAAKDTAELASRAKSDFLSMVSHELRTPLTSVIGFARMINRRLLRDVAPVLPESASRAKEATRQMGENIAIIIAEGRRLTDLINDVLDISKMEAGKQDFKSVPIDIARLVDHACTTVEALVEQKGLRLNVEIVQPLPDVCGDPDRIIQVLINLLSNAVKFTERGAVTCRAETSSGLLLVSVRDNGIGIAPGDQGIIFDTFRQLGDTLTDRPKGTGLGLAICRQIVERHGGVIKVESQPGKGSIFSFTLPTCSGYSTL